MIVTKFGGSSLCSASQIKKACAVQLADKRRQIMVVSAPGKRFKDDIKVTDLLIALAESSYEKSFESYKDQFMAVMQRFKDMIADLNLCQSVFLSLESDLKQRLSRGIGDNKIAYNKYLDLIKSAGEDYCARITAQYLVSINVKAQYLNPLDSGMILSDESSNARVLESSYTALRKLKQIEGIGVYPGFFGYDKDGNVVTFGRGGSDITGSVLAVAVDAELYENFTDVDSVFAASPSLVPNPVSVPEITYREMRELAYAGFTVLHEESVEPVMRAGILLNIKNLDNPDSGGTRIVKSRDISAFPLAGIAGTDGFCVLTVGKFLMNRELGFGRKLFQLLEEENLSFDHAPSGIDTISPIFKQINLSPKKQERLVYRIKEELKADFVEITKDIALIMLVGQGLFSLNNAAFRALNAINAKNIDVEVLIMCGANNESLAIGVKSKHLKETTLALYNEFF